MDFGSFGNIGGTLTKVLAYGLIFLVVIIFAAGGAWLLALKKNFAKYAIHIYRRRKIKNGVENLFFVGTDKGGIIKDKKNKKTFFRMLKNKFNLEPGTNKDGEFDILAIPNLKGGELIIMEEVSPKRFVFLDPIEIDGNIKLNVLPEDTAEAMREFDMNVRLSTNKNKELIVALSIIGVTGMVLVILLFSMSKQLIEFAKVMQEIAPIMQQTAANLAAAKSNVIASGVPV